MLEIRDKNASTPEARKQDISSWQEATLTRLNSKAKKRFSKNKSAITAYFTGDKSIKEITTQYNLSTEQLLKMAKNCLKQHEDGSPWGYRALVPGILVKDHSADLTSVQPEDQDTAIDNESTTQEPQIQEPSSDGDNLEDTAKRSAITSTPSDSTETLVERVPAQSPDSAETNGIASAQDQQTEAASTPVAKVSETDSFQQKNQLSSLPQESLLEEDIPTEPIAVEEQVVENAGEIAIQEPITSPDEQQPGPLQQEESPVESEIKAVAIINDSLVQLQQVARVTAPLLLEETIISSPIDIYLLPKYAKQGTRTTTTQIAQRRRFVRKRWLRDAQDKTKRNRIYRTVSITMVSVILLSLLLPIGVGLAAYNVYNNVSGLAHDGVNHLMSVKALLPTSKSDIMAALNVSKLQQAQGQLKAAETDFIQLQQLADRPDIASIIEQVAPQYAGKLTMAKHLLQVALDVTRMGQELSGVGIIAAGIVHSSPLATGSAKPLITTSEVSDIKAAITHALYYMDDIQQNMSQVQLNNLPVSAKQKAELSAVLTQLPAIRNLIVQNQNMIDLVTWLLGVGQPRRFLIQTMDTGELRPGGGFTGQYGVLSIQNGRVAPFTLRDVALLDYAGNGSELGRQAPSQYSSWMNFGNWGLRDSNLSGDYPTTAQINKQVFQEEGGGPIDGVIDFTPTFIGHIIDVTGPIHVSEYNETITSANLEDRLHYYQQDYSAIATEQQISHDYSHQARKQFTSLLGKLLLSRVSHLPTTKLITIIKNAVKDIQSRDLEIYFTDPAAEQWLVKNGYSGATSTFSKQDGFMLVQANISISKASQYVHTTEQDNITLDAQGGATHTMTITLDYNRAGRNVYGITTYSDYMRLYVPQSSQLISGDGFDTGHPLCGIAPPSFQRGNTGVTTTSVPPVSACNSLPSSQTLYCPGGDYSLGVRASNLPATADVMGAPTATTSDLPGRGMFGGMTVTPSDCTSTIMLSWYVPNAVKHSGKNLLYPLFIQKQGGLTPSLELSVDASAIKGMKSFSFKGNMHADRLFNIR